MPLKVFFALLRRFWQICVGFKVKVSIKFIFINIFIIWKHILKSDKSHEKVLGDEIHK